MSTKSRSYVFTLNNYTQEEYNELLEIEARYKVIGKEVGEQGTPHLQGYIYFENPKSMNPLKKINKRIHWEQAKGTPVQASEYCKKENNFYEDGELPSQGRRSDIEEARELVKTTGKIRDVVDKANSFQAIRCAEVILKYHEKPRNWKPEVHWFYGSSGTGKTKLAYEVLGEDCYTCMGTGKWFDGYDAHENVLIDDIRKDFMSFDQFIKLIDRYAYRVETKGGTRQFLARKIIITSPCPPELIWKNTEDKYQLLRRIDVVKCFDKKEYKECEEEEYIEDEQVFS